LFWLKKEFEGDKWEVILKPGKKAKPGIARFVFGNGELKAELLEVLDEGNRLVKIHI
jgi:S-adenosylmethionine:tRNA ribosyltransferase-isomerase